MKTTIAMLGPACVSFLALAALNAAAQAVPLSKAEEESRRRSAETAGAIGIVSEVKSGMHHVPSIVDAYTGNNYKSALGTYGSAIGVVGGAAQVTEGYYRDGWSGAMKAGVNVAVDYGVEAIATSMAATSGVAAAPVVAAGAVGLYAGRAIDQRWGNEIFNATGGAAFDAGFAAYDQMVLEPRRQEQADRMRERFREMKAQNAAQSAAQAAASYTPMTPQPAAGPSPVDTFLNTMMQVQQAQQAQLQSQRPAQPAADKSSSGSGNHNADSFCPIPHTPGVCPAGAKAGATPPAPVPMRKP